MAWPRLDFVLEDEPSCNSNAAKIRLEVENFVSEQIQPMNQDTRTCKRLPPNVT